MKKCTTYTLEWDEEEEEYVQLPERCLSLVVANKGASKIAVDETVELEPNQVYPLEHHTGYYHEGQVRLRIINTAPPFAAQTRVHLRMTVEVNS